MSKTTPAVASPSFRIDNEVTRCIRQHARSHMKTEVCGVLIGENHAGVVEVRASIEATNAAQAGTHVTFTQDAWETIYRVKDESYPDERIVGWYHSHPGFGVFLSEHDMFIQRNFFSNPDQVAWVYDPHTDEEGCFGWVNGDIHRISNFTIVDNNGDGSERTPKEMETSQTEAADPSSENHRERDSRPTPLWVRFATTTLAFLIAMALGFAISYFLFPRLVLVMVDPMTGELIQVPPDAIRLLSQHPPAGSGNPPSGATPTPQPRSNGTPEPSSGRNK